MSYLSTLYSDAEAGYVAVWQKQTKQTKFFPVADLESAAAYMSEMANKGDTYFGWGLQKEALGSSSRGTSKTVNFVPGIMFDADLRSSHADVHAETDLPSSLEEVVEFLDAVQFPPPTAIRNSGNGLYLDWLYHEPKVFSGDEGQQALAELSRRLHKALIRAAQSERGWSFDNTGDLARITRMPGTLNHKTNPPKKVTLLSYDENSRYSIDEIEAAVRMLEDRFPESPIGHPASESNTLNKYLNGFDGGNFEASNDNDAKPEFKSIVAGCSWVRSCIECAESLPEPHWYALAGIVGLCENGREVFHKVSAPYRGYTPSETDAKFDQAIAASGPRTCSNIETELGCSDCRNCPFKGKLTSPISLGYRDKDIVDLMRSYAVDVDTQAYVDLEFGKRLSEKSFNVKFSDRTGKSQPATLMIRNSLTKKVDRVDYLPGNQNLFSQTTRKEEILNLWKPGDIVPVEGDCTLLCLTSAPMGQTA
jgi:hypothetical protein